MSSLSCKVINTKLSCSWRPLFKIWIRYHAISLYFLMLIAYYRFNYNGNYANISIKKIHRVIIISITICFWFIEKRHTEYIWTVLFIRVNDITGSIHQFNWFVSTRNTNKHHKLKKIKYKWTKRNKLNV